MAYPTSNACRTATEIEHVAQLTNHWWWRPGWRDGRHYYACHITFEDQPEVHGLVDTYQRALASVAGLDLIPTPWLHLTMQGIGFVDEVDADELARVANTIRQELDGYPALRVTFHRPVVRPEAIYLPAEPADAIRRVRACVRFGIGKALGIDRVRGTDDEVRQYRPHVSLPTSTPTRRRPPLSKRCVEPTPIR